MTGAPSTKALLKLPKSKFPRCLRCNKRVESLTVAASANSVDKVTVAYECHGEHVSQEISRAVLESAQGLTAYTAFNAYTSGLMLGEKQKKSTKSSGKI
jgi:hypothetical protein